MDNLVPALDPSEYGQMPPSFHSNSQRVAKNAAETDDTEDSATREARATGLHAEPLSKPIRPPILPRDEYDGVDSDDETNSDESEDSESEEDKPQVVGDIEIDMKEEQDDFLEFARQQLNMSDEHWNEIVQERTQRGGM